jgi:hypothetical protein
MSISTGANNKNTSESAVPSAYRIVDVGLKNAYGKEFDIKNLVTKITITESLYMYALLAEIEIRDTVNLFEELRISGQEVITIAIQKRDKKSNDNVNLKMKFYVSEVPTFGKVNDHVQAYVLKAVSEHAVVNNLVSISRTMIGSISKAISSIVSNDLRYNGVVETIAETKGNVRVIVPNMKPFVAIDWLLRHSFGENGSPVYAYDSMWGFKIHSYQHLSTQPSVGVYKYNFIQNSSATTKEGYDQLKYKILNMSSNMNASRYIHSARGAFASKTRVLDYSKKSYYDVEYDYQSKFKTIPKVDYLNGKSVLSNQYIIKDETLNHHYDSLYIYMNENSMANGNYSNYHSPALESIGVKQSIVENLDMFKINISINGDLDINAGKKITVEAPKSIDPQVYKKVRNADAKKKNALNDMMVSGDYLIVTVRHVFDTEYTCDLLLKRDYSNYSLDAAE